CTQTGGANIDELMDLFAEGATWTIAGVTSLVGKPAIREMFHARAARYWQDVQIRGIELSGDLGHLPRRATRFNVRAGWTSAWNAGTAREGRKDRARHRRH